MGSDAACFLSSLPPPPLLLVPLLSVNVFRFDLSCQTRRLNCWKRRGIVVRAGKKAALGLTKRSRSRKSLARTHGFRRRMRTTNSRATVKRRRAKRRRNLCPNFNLSNGKG